MTRIQSWNRVWNVCQGWILATLLMGSAWAASDFDQARKAYEQGDQEAAVAGFERALQGAPGGVGVLYNLGNAYYMKQDYEKSINAYLLALKLNPDSAECHFNIASAFRDNKQFKEAELHYETSLKLNKSNPETYY